MLIETRSGMSRRTSTFVDTNSFVSHPARVTIKHPQLRDLICKTANPHEVLFVSDRVVKSIDTDTGKTAQCAEFAFEPRCLSSAYGIIAAGGGRRGQLGITYRRPEEDTDNRVDLPVTMIELGGYINNSVTLFKPGAASVSALVCNNDHTLRILDINDSSYAVIDTLQLPVSLNHASISPDRKSIIACGDSAHLFVFHPEERKRRNEASDEATRVDSLGPLKWARTATLATSADGGFSTAFSPSGVLFAVASQDGLASIYDSRYLSDSSSTTYLSTRNVPKPLKYIESTRPREAAGAFRCLKFSTGPENLLLISEQADRVHVVDTRRFEDRQILDISNTVNDPIRSMRRRRDNSGNDNSNPPSGGASGPSSGPSDSSLDAHRRRLVEIMASSQYPEKDEGISGIAWSDEEQGSVIVGWDSGIGKWTVNRR
ncbi:hypothetical protein POJ06DRAFT_83268 [Lipomyces tetrasporus]|uniref:DUF2415 domain-containing protein n=1 Tax=Lipomyces tetrasporus TaxID=54092 RepID=A0AAD7VSC0_9ASCO|nr:uncharacterized protein POJ06DRAFT_83268 [Lipomyces tetrasporus]KAJ8100867.1 hypothetical protein POJ06DRAFT_83268 [Lipomyces tetrasporus]